MRHGIYEIGEAFTDPSDLAWHVNRVCEVVKLSRCEELFFFLKGN